MFTVFKLLDFRLVLNILLLTQVAFPLFFITLTLFLLSIFLTFTLLLAINCFNQYMKFAYYPFVIGEVSYVTVYSKYLLKIVNFKWSNRLERTLCIKRHSSIASPCIQLSIAISQSRFLKNSRRHCCCILFNYCDCFTCQRSLYARGYSSILWVLDNSKKWAKRTKTMW